jgi:hypothetical protein
VDAYRFGHLGVHIVECKISGRQCGQFLHFLFCPGPTLLRLGTFSSSITLNSDELDHFRSLSIHGFGFAGRIRRRPHDLAGIGSTGLRQHITSPCRWLWPNPRKSSLWKCWNSSRGKAVVPKRGASALLMIRDNGYSTNIRCIIKTMLGFTGQLRRKVKLYMFRRTSWSSA